MVLTQACLCPLLSTVFGLLAFFIGYAIAVAKNHVDAFLPFISDCGNLQPESGIFGILLNLSSFCLMLTCYFVYRNFIVFEEKVQHNYPGPWKWISMFLMFWGIISSLGATMVANFQEGVQLTVHDTGAFLFFIGITVYFWGQIIIGLVYRPKSVTMFMTIFRLLLCIAITGFLIFHMVALFASPFVKKINGAKPTKPDFPNGIERYKKGDPFYANHIAQTLSEWILALLIEAFVLTFTYDLAYTCLESPTIMDKDSFRNMHTTEAEEIFYTNQVAPMTDKAPTIPENIVMRKLPRLDTYGTYSQTGNKTRVSAFSNGDNGASSSASTPPYDSNKMVSSYNQYQYF